MEQECLSYNLYFSHFSGGLGSRLEAAVLCTNPGALDLAHPHPRFSKHLKTKPRTQPHPPCTCLGFPVLLHFHHLEPIITFKTHQADQGSMGPLPKHTHTSLTLSFQSGQVQPLFPQ